MTGSPFAPRAPGCLSDLRIDRWLAGELAPAEEASARAHTEGCVACTGRRRDIQAARDAGVDPAGLEAIRRAAAAGAGDESARRRRLWPPLVLALGFSGIAAFALFRGPDPPFVRPKGGPQLGFFVKHGEAVRRGGPGEVVTPGDLVRFTYTSAAPAYLAIVGLDAAGVITVYFNGAAERLPAGRDVALPRSTLLDDTLGSEAVQAFFCAGPIDLAAAQRAVQGDPRQAPVPAGCTVDRLVWNKEPRR